MSSFGERYGAGAVHNQISPTSFHPSSSGWPTLQCTGESYHDQILDDDDIILSTFLHFL